MYILTIVLLIIICAVLGIRDKKNTEAWVLTHKLNYLNRIFPQYESFFKSAILTYANDLKIRRVSGLGENKFIISRVFHQIDHKLSIMCFKVICDDTRETDKLTDKLSSKISKCVETIILDEYKNKFGQYSNEKDFIKVKIKMKSPTEMLIAFAIPNNYVVDFNDEAIF